MTPIPNSFMEINKKSKQKGMKVGDIVTLKKGKKTVTLKIKKVVHGKS